MDYSDYQQLAQNLHKQIRRQTINSNLFKSLVHRRYRDPKGYACHKEVMLDIASNLLMAEKVSLHVWQAAENSSRTATALIQEWYRTKSSVYWLDCNLFEAFLQTDIPEQIGDLKQSIPTGILMLPKGLKTPDGENLQWIVFAHRLKVEPPTPLRLGRMVYGDAMQDHDRLVWSALLPSTTAYAHDLRVDYPLEFVEVKGRAPWDDSPSSPDAERAFIRQVDAILLQTLLIAQIHPELLEVEAPHSQPGGKSRAKAAITEKWLNPNWIGKKFVPQVASSSKPTSRAIPTGRQTPFHWRRGHMRRVAVGKRSEGRREWKWIRPYIVGLEE